MLVREVMRSVVVFLGLVVVVGGLVLLFSADKPQPDVPLWLVLRSDARQDNEFENSKRYLEKYEISDERRKRECVMGITEIVRELRAKDAYEIADFCGMPETQVKAVAEKWKNKAMVGESDEPQDDCKVLRYHEVFELTPVPQVVIATAFRCELDRGNGERAMTIALRSTELDDESKKKAVLFYVVHLLTKPPICLSTAFSAEDCKRDGRIQRNKAIPLVARWRLDWNLINAMATWVQIGWLIPDAYDLAKESFPQETLLYIPGRVYEH